VQEGGVAGGDVDVARGEGVGVGGVVGGGEGRGGGFALVEGVLDEGEGVD
jgi:hypothetical protein